MSTAVAATGEDWILVVDDDAACRTLLSSLLGRVGFGTREAATGSEALAAVASERPAAVILDVELPGISGYEVCRELRDRFGQELPIVFVSGTRVESFDRAAGIMLGADDYVVKPFDPDELLARVRRLASHAGRRESARGGHDLTRREREVLGLLASGNAQEEIANRLFITSNTVATHIQRILGKLGVHSRAQAVALAHRERLVRDLDRPPSTHSADGVATLTPTSISTELGDAASSDREASPLLPR
jgi:DNA-binding NarL/FixJ family response regulator